MGVKLCIQSTRHWNHHLTRLVFNTPTQDVFVDKGRAEVFKKAKIQTAFAVPIVMSDRATPVGVVCCYSMIQSGSVPFVLRFVQQALHLLWSGLDKVHPHESVGKEMWQDVGPADLGEMAADVEMQHHFFNKKRPRSDSIVELGDVPHPGPSQSDESTQLQSQFKKFDFNNHEDDAGLANAQPTYEMQRDEELYFKPDPKMNAQAYQAFQNHIKEAVRQVGEALPFSHHHVTTTQDGSKRAHVGSPPKAHHHPPKMRVGHPLAMPHALPNRVVKSSYGHHVDLQNLSPQLLSSTSSQITKNLAGAGLMHQESASARAQNISQQPPQFAQQQQIPTPQSAPMQNSMPPPAPVTMNHIQINQQGIPLHHQQQQQQYQFDGQGQFQSQDQMYQGSTEPMHFGGVGYSNNSTEPPQFAPMATAQLDYPNSVQQQTAPTNSYCIPADSGAYPAPDISTTISAPQAADPTSNANVKTCRIHGCDEPCVARRPYCLRHSGNRLCEHEGCQKCAQGSTRFCIAHGGGRRCTFPGCDKGARDKFFCAAHGGGKRCKFEGCNKSAVGGSSFCTAHGGGRRCCVEGCNKSAQSSTKFCVKHGGGKKCAHEGCDKVARGRTLYCAAVSRRLFCVKAGVSFEAES